MIFDTTGAKTQFVGGWVSLKNKKTNMYYSSIAGNQQLESGNGDSTTAVMDRVVAFTMLNSFFPLTSSTRKHNHTPKTTMSSPFHIMGLDWFCYFQDCDFSVIFLAANDTRNSDRKKL